MQGLEWVYRESQDRTLGDMNKKIISQLSPYLPSGTRVTAMSTNAESVIEEGCAGVQITAVQRDLESINQAAIGGGVGGTGFTRCGRFMFDTPVLFTEDGEVSQGQGAVVASLRYQGRRRTIITVDGQFPSLLPRAPIIDTTVEEMNPCSERDSNARGANHRVISSGARS